MNTRTCPDCKASYPDDYAFCPECGVKLVQEERGSQRPSTVGKARETPEPAIEAHAPSKRPRFRLVKLARGGGSREEREIPESGITIGRRTGDVLLTEDPTVSPEHAAVYRKGPNVLVRDLDSLNGILVRIRTDTELTDGDVFLCGDQVFVVRLFDQVSDGEEWKRYLAPSEKRPLGTVSHMLEDGCEGQVFAIKSLPFTIGREEGDARFPYDRFMSRKHASIRMGKRGLVLSDLGSRNGTYLKRTGEVELGAGDIFMVGRQLFRIEALDL